MEDKLKELYVSIKEGSCSFEVFKEFLEREKRFNYDQGFEAGYERGYYNSITMRKRGC